MDISDPWKLAVDVAQILSAVATTAAVIVSLVLSRRAETQRPKLFISFTQYIPSVHPFEISATVVNAGLLPFWVTSMHFHIPTEPKGWGWARGGKSDFEIQHGRQEVQLIRVTDEPHWLRARRQIGWMPKNRPYYSVSTSLGNTHIRRMSYAQVKVLRRMIRATETGDFSGRFFH